MTALRHTHRLASTSDPFLAPDKRYHFIACFVLVLFFYGSLLLLLHQGPALANRIPFANRLSRRLPSWKTRLGVSASLSLAVGITKEAGDAIDLWPYLCPPCQASWTDFVADALGVAVASALIAVVPAATCSGPRWLFRRCGMKLDDVEQQMPRLEEQELESLACGKGRERPYRIEEI